MEIIPGGMRIPPLVKNDVKITKRRYIDWNCEFCITSN
ncbi:MAG: hypothetical protein JETT_1691 [Candidatus Jettenia ecosi]|uniref:Uncharacterized protein n=1 Tax=Candidatus Jettenia ecosi TaxID=2494326 RepID=A0A533QC83_9BACT|nr:MAG: hypothetical protein JETT_1691 [Candidatus Jettenia ecosi]